MSINKVFIDMDGVVADFVKGALEVHNKPDPWKQNPKHKGSYDIDKIWDLSPVDFWGPIHGRSNFWYMLDKTPEADSLIEIFDSLKLTEKHKDLMVFFASAPTPNVYCYAGKFEWVQVHYPKMYNHLILTKYKHLYASKDSLLIDDADRNVNSFRKAGGNAILFPRPWNSAYAISDVDIMKYMKHEIRRHL